jgi:hypothetical protein
LALQAHPELDWIFSACRRIDVATGQILVPNTFYTNGKPWPFLKLRSRIAGKLQVIEDPAASCCMILAGLNCGLQTSVIRRRLFENFRFTAHYRNEAEDQLAVIWALVSGYHFAYFDDVHVIYHVHTANSSASGVGAWQKQFRVIELETRGYEELQGRIQLTPAEQSALKRRLIEQYFWQLGYAFLWQNGQREQALEMFRRGLQLCPWNLRYWKTYLLAWIRLAVRLRWSPHATKTNFVD